MNRRIAALVALLVGGFALAQSTGYKRIQDETNKLPSRPTLRIAGGSASCVDTPGDDLTTCTFVGSADGGSSSPIRYATDYGALCDGVTDDRPAIQTAISAGQGTVMLPGGTCIIGSPGLKTNDNSILAGIGRGATTLKLKAAANSSVITNTGGGGDTRVTIRDLGIDGNKANNTTGSGIVGLWFVIRLESLYIFDTNQEGVWFQTPGTDQTLLDVHENRSDTIGLRHSGDALFVLGGAWEYNGQENVRLEGRVGYLASYSEGDLSIPAIGVHVKGGQSYTITRMKFSSEVSYCIKMDGGAFRNTVIDNWLSNATAINLFMDSSTYDNYVGPQYTDDFQLGGIIDRGRNLRNDWLRRSSEDRISWNRPLPRGMPTSLLTYRSFEDGDEWTSSATTKSFIYYKTDDWRDGAFGNTFMRLLSTNTVSYAHRTISSPTTGVDVVVTAKQMPYYNGTAPDGRVTIYDNGGALLANSERYSYTVSPKEVFVPAYIPGGTTSVDLRLEVGQTAFTITDWNEVDAFYSEVKNGDMERPFTAGVAENWGCFSGATCTDETVIKYQGGHSQKVTGNNPALVQQTLALTDGLTYRVRVTAYLGSGSFRCGIGDTTAASSYGHIGQLDSDSSGQWVIMDQTVVKHAGISNILRCHAITSPSTFYIDTVAVWPVGDDHIIQGPLKVNGTLRAASSKTAGTITLAAGTGTATVLSAAKCVCTDSTAALPVKCAVAGTTLTATGTGTDVIIYQCLGS